ncbi:UNVERIFIED_CONTAM: hypothetical protein RF648_18430 [Kocuria sp. CPCC 205274]|nr:hypothetical protein [Herbiconiux daphne]
MAVFGPYFKEIAVAKMDFALLGSAEKGIQSVNRVLEKIDNASKEAIE